MKKNYTSMKVAPEFKSFVKKAAINHAYIKKLENPISQTDVQLRIVKYFKLNNDIYINLINMEDKNA